MLITQNNEMLKDDENVLGKGKQTIALNYLTKGKGKYNPNVRKKGKITRVRVAT